MKISKLDLEPATIDFLKSEGYEKLFEPQADAVKAGLFDAKKNILVTIPTASGKTLIAMLATLSHLSKHKTKVVYLSPLRALTSEKYEEFKKLEKLNIGRKITVALSTGDSKEKTKLKDADVIFLTNESMDANMAFQQDWIYDIGMVISDEIHLIGDELRGSTLEIILTRFKSGFIGKRPPRIIGLSATISNANDLAGWLDCELIESTFRRVPLSEGVYHQNEITNKDGSFKEANKIDVKNPETGEFESTTRHEKEWLGLGLDTIDDGDQCLVFAMTRKNAVAWARNAAIEVNKILNDNQKKELEKISMKILPKSKDDTTKLITELANAVKNGTAFHHAGLDQRCRTIVETEYKNRHIKLLTATPTLAAGVNLPARRVIIPSLSRFTIHGPSDISVLEYKQMCGRAGRPEYDDVGESIIISKGDPASILNDYVRGEPEPLESQTFAQDSILRINLLGFIHKVSGNYEKIIKFFSQTFAAFLLDNPNEIEIKIKEQLEELRKCRAINIKNDIKVSSFGKQVFQLRIDPKTAFEMSSYVMNLSSARRHTFGILDMLTNLGEFSLQNKLPSKLYDKMQYYIKGDQPLYKNQWKQECSTCLGDGVMDDDEKCHLCNGTGIAEMPEVKNCNQSLLIIYEWIDAKTFEKMSDEINAEPGDIYYITQNAENLLYIFSKIVEFWKDYEIVNGNKQIASKYQRLFNECNLLKDRIHHGVPDKYLDLVEIKQIGRIRAQILYKKWKSQSALKQFLKNDKNDVKLKELAAIDKIGMGAAKSIKSKVT